MRKKHTPFHALPQIGEQVDTLHRVAHVDEFEGIEATRRAHEKDGVGVSAARRAHEGGEVGFGATASSARHL